MLEHNNLVISSLTFFLVFLRKMMKICNLPATEENLRDRFQSYEIIPAKKECVNGHEMFI